MRRSAASGAGRARGGRPGAGAGRLEERLAVDEEAVKAELPQVEEHLARFGDELPGPVRDQLEALQERPG